MKTWHKAIIFSAVVVLIIVVVSINIVKEKERQALREKYSDEFLYENEIENQNTGIGLEEQETIDSDNALSDSADEQVQAKETPERLEAAKSRLAEEYADSFATQETLYKAEEEAYYELQELWDSLSENDKEALKATYERLGEDYYSSPSTHLTLFKAEIEAYKNMSN